MKGKKFFLILIVFVCFLTLSGCNNEKGNEGEKDNKQNKTVEKEQESVVSKMYSDDKKKVYDNGVYKMVFFYTGNTIDKVEHYYEYENEKTAIEHYEKDKEELKYNTSILNVSRVGKYVIYTVSMDDYRDIKVDTIQENFSYLTEVTK